MLKKQNMIQSVDSDLIENLKQNEIILIQKEEREYTDAVITL